MNNLHFFTTGLLLVSTVVGLMTEAIKKVLTEHNKVYRANTLAGIVALVLASATGIAYVIFTGAAFTAPVIVEIIAFVIASWLCAMLGYDKVIQTVCQFKKETNEE